MADLGVDVGSPDWWLARLIQRLGDRQNRYDRLEDYVKGRQPLPDGDRRYVNALQDLQKKAQTNYIALVIKAVTQRMRVKDFKFAGEVDKEAARFWRYNNMELQAPVGIYDAATYSESYALVSPPDEDDPNGIPIITIESPRCCIVENDPVRPLKRLAGLRLYQDDIIEKMVAVLYLPDATLVYFGPHPGEQFDYEITSRRIKHGGASAAGFDLQEIHDNPVGEVPLVCGPWQPESYLAECEDGAFEIQDRINHTMLARLIITKAQAYRQRMVAGAKIPQSGARKGKPPFDPGADMVWVIDDPQAKVYDLEQADITQLLEAIRDDVGDLAALTQTPVTYLTNRMVNVSGDTLHAAQHSHVAKVRRRMDAMGWYFESIMKLCFRYKNDQRANEIDAEVHWADPEVRTMAEMADLVSKFNEVIPLQLIMERVGFSADEIDRAVTQIKEERDEQQTRDLELAEKQAAIRAAGSRAPGGASKPSSGGGGSGGSSSVKPSRSKPARSNGSSSSSSSKK